MTKKEWLTSFFVAVGVAAMTVGLSVLPTAWAEQTPEVKPVPALPSAKLTIPSINAQVSAMATPAPGQPVQVKLGITSPPGSQLGQVPVTVTVLSTTMYPMSRSMPMPKQVVQLSQTVSVDSYGNGTANVELPLKWANAEIKEKSDKDTFKLNEQTTTYQMVLSSTLGGKAAPETIQTVPGENKTGNQQNTK
jgi:hypothetical protein